MKRADRIMLHTTRHRRLIPVLAVAALLTAAAGPATHPEAPAPAKRAAAEPAVAPAPAAPAAVPADARPPADRAPLPPVNQIRELQGQEYSNAVDARDAADLLRAAYEGARSRRLGNAAPPPAANDVEFDRVAAAYRQAIARYPGTEFEHSCRTRLAGAYQFRGQFDRAIDEAKQDAERFEGTKLGLEAIQSVGLIYLQAIHDPAQAKVWFNKLKIAAGTINDDQVRQKWGAAAAQGLTRSDEELARGKK
jgi:hypothetical protein